MRSLLLAAAAVATAPLCLADFTADFEAPTYIVGPIAGQNGWYIPPSVGGDPHDIFAYAGNPLLIPANPEGGAQFDGAKSINGTTGLFPRAQIDHDFGPADSWTISANFCGKYLGDPNLLPASNNLGSVSFQDSASVLGMIALASWPDPVLTPDVIQLGFIGEDASGLATAQPGYFPGGDPMWTSMTVDTWYEICYCVDFGTKQLTRACLRDITNGGTAKCFDVADLFLGGALIGNPKPTGMRLFVGGGDDNVSAFDNFSITSGACGCGGAGCKWDLNGDGKVCQEDLGALLAGFGTLYNQADLGGLLSEYGTCGGACP
jgi:hypothetical protein